MIKLTTVSVMLLCMLAACDVGGQRRFDREEWIEEYENRQPKRVKPGQIVSQLEVEGQALGAALRGFSPASNAACCPELPVALKDSLQQKYQARIRCFSLEQEPAGSAREKALLEAYAFNLSQGLPLEAATQQDGDSYYLYLLPQSSDSCQYVWSFRFSVKYLVNQI